MTAKGQKRDELAPKQRLFVEYYTTPNTDTFGNSFKSYVKAGYSNKESSRVSACQILTVPKISYAIEQTRTKNNDIKTEKQIICREYAVGKWQELYDRAWIDHDNTTGLGLLRMLWQSAHLLDNTLIIDARQAEQLEAGLAMQAKQVAAFILNGSLPALPGQQLLQPSSQPIDAAFESDNVSRETPDDIQPVVCSDTTSDNNYGEDDKPCNGKDLQNQ